MSYSEKNIQHVIKILQIQFSHLIRFVQSVILSALLSTILSCPLPVPLASCLSYIRLPVFLFVCAPPQASSGVPMGRGASTRVGGATAGPTAETTQTRLAAIHHLEAASFNATAAPAASPTRLCAIEKLTVLAARTSTTAVREVSATWC